MVPGPTNDSHDNPASPDFDEPASSLADTEKRAPVRSGRSRLVWRISYVSQPLLFVFAGVLVLGLLGLAQRVGWISSIDSHNHASVESAEAENVDYICPMMCTPPQKEMGRCPVCAMELVPASSSGSGGDERSIVVDPASRRVANIQTVSVRSVPMTRTIRAVGELHYDEGKLKTISAYTDGRFDRLYVDFTGAEVKQGDRLASFYSPELYSAQIEYILAVKAANRQSAQTPSSVAQASRRLRESSQQRLIELGMSAEQIELLDRNGEAQSRLDIVAPMSGTVIEKVAVEGEYAKEGQPIFKLADLSTVWLILELFPHDAAVVRYGQAVETKVKSLPGKTFRGRVAFIAPEVDPQSRTVSVRVMMDNRDGILRIGDYAKATITVPLSQSQEEILVYDPELANKWICPRHPHVTSEISGICPLSGQELVPTSTFGFTDQPQSAPSAKMIPRNAVLMAADHCVVYVETKPGRFEIRRIITGTTSGEEVLVVKGLAAGEKVATNGNFLLDSQMQLAGNPSLIDPTRATSPTEMRPGISAKMLAAIEQLPQMDQELAINQMFCPVTDFKLGSMGVPPKVMVKGQPVFLCCEGCRDSLLDNADTHLEKLRNNRSGDNDQHNPRQKDGMLPPMGEMESIIMNEAFPPLGEMKLIPSAAESPHKPNATNTSSASGRILR